MLKEDQNPMGAEDPMKAAATAAQARRLKTVGTGYFPGPAAVNPAAAGRCCPIVATDPGSVKDFEVLTKQTGNELLSSSQWR